jgi:hypothetical protein
MVDFLSCINFTSIFLVYFRKLTFAIYKKVIVPLRSGDRRWLQVLPLINKGREGGTRVTAGLTCTLGRGGLNIPYFKALLALCW